MIRKIKLLYNFIKNFGWFYGLSIFFNFMIKKTDKIKIPGIKQRILLRQQTSDLVLFYRIFFESEYALPKFNKPKVIIDAGANIGLFTLLMKNIYPDATVICIEPDKDNFEVLKKNTSELQHVYCENAGLWNKTTKLKIFDKFNLGKWGMFTEEDEVNGTVNAISIDHIIEKYQINQIDILKIDIEASEKYLFSANYEKWLPLTKVIVIEFHDRLTEGCSKPFFVAINKHMNNYAYSTKGENTIIENLDF